MQEKRKSPQWLAIVVAVPIIILMNFIFDLGFIPAVLIGGGIGGAVGVIIQFIYRR